MKIWKKIKFIIITAILIMMISSNFVQAEVTLSGLSGVETIIGMGSDTITNGGTYINLSLKNMTSSSNKNLYCMAYHNKNSSSTVKYKVLTYIEIADGVATMWDVNGVKGRSSGYNIANKILAEILTGKYGATGYGTAVGKYTPTQKGLYTYMPQWIAQVGLSLGVDYSWTNSNFSDSEGSSVVNKATAAVASGANASASIYLLNEWESIGQAWQRLMIATASFDDEPPPPPPDDNYDGYIKIQGKVWVDGSWNKASKINGKYGDSGEKNLSGIKVTLCDSNGSQFDPGSYAYTNSKGEYEIKVNRDYGYNVYKLYDEPTSVDKRLMNGAYVKFEYNGFLYTTVEASKTGQKTSKATEDYGTRSSFDSKYATADPSSSTPSANVTATTKSMLIFKSYEYKKTQKESVSIKYCYGQGKTKSYNENDSDPTDRTYQLTNPDGDWLDVQYEYNKTAHNRHRHSHDESYNPKQYHIEYDEETGEEISRKEIFKDVFDYLTWCSGGHSIGSKSVTNLIIYNVNLGLFTREQPDIALTSDIARVEVTMNKQKYTYEYGNKGIEKYNDDKFTPKVKFQNKYTYTYRRPVNPADVAYINDGSGKDNKLKITVTYKVLLKNQSTTLSVKVNKLKAFYDPEYEIVSHEYTTANSGSTKFKVATINNINTGIIKAGGQKVVEITYDISQKAIKGLIKQDATLNNALEIHTYSTHYGGSTLYAEEKTGGRTGNKYAGRDTDSTPGNAPIVYDTKNSKLNISKQADFQDDTDIAPSFVLLLDKYKVVAGTVYEDAPTKESLGIKERLGNGVKDKNELSLANVKVELLLLDDNGKMELDETKNPKVAKLYKITDRKNGKKQAIDAVTWTDKNGNFSFGDESTQGVVVDNYIIRYTYGNDDIKGDGKNVATTLNGQPINARNFKSTIVTQNPIKGILQGTNSSKRWHLETDDNTTVAVDNLKIRKKATDDVELKYGTFNKGTNVSADSPVFDLQVEYTDELKSNVNQKGQRIVGNVIKGFKHTISTFDFGIIERPREDLIIDKTVTKLKLTLANGQVLIDGDPRVESLDYTKAIGVRNPSADARTRNVLDKLISIEMDSEYIQGATLEAWYEVTATNNSEKDYEYSEAEDTNGQGKEYYYFGDKEGLTDENLIDNSIELVVDYLDPELMCTIEEGGEDKEAINTDWAVITADELKDKGYISNETYKKLKAENYLIFGTSIFNSYLPTGTSRSTSLYASKLLANQEDALVYENHTEIISINGKVARTINSVEGTKRVQNPKTYIPGDYTLLREYHQQDDDMVKIVITPPTGLKDKIIMFIITTAIALSVIGIRVYIIKKKVIK